jgi:hypothetical protein
LRSWPPARPSAACRSSAPLDLAVPACMRPPMVPLPVDLGLCEPSRGLGVSSDQMRVDRQDAEDPSTSPNICAISTNTAQSPPLRGR